MAVAFTVCNDTRCAYSARSEKVLIDEPRTKLSDGKISLCRKAG